MTEPTSNKLASAIGLLVEHFEEMGVEIGASGSSDYMEAFRDGVSAGAFEVTIRRTDIAPDEGDIAGIFRGLGTALQSLKDNSDRKKARH